MSSAAVPTTRDGRACSATSCAVVHGAGQSNYVARGHRVSVEYTVQVTGPTAAVVLDVAGSGHLHLTGGATVNSAAPTKGSVSKHGTHVRVALPNYSDPGEQSYIVDVAAAVDNTARTDMPTSASVSITAPGTKTATAHTALIVVLDRPAVYVYLPHSVSIRAGHHRQVEAIFTNLASITTRTATLWISLPAHTTLSATWGVMFDNRRMHCTGSGRHYRCTITRMRGYEGGLLIDVRAARHAPHRYVGHLALRGEPTGYSNGGTQNTASTRVTVKR